MELVEHIPTLQYFNVHIWQLSRQLITTKQLQLFHPLNGYVFYTIRTWPTNIQQLFWKKPTGDNDSFKLMLFFIGNGYPPELIAKWILTSQHLALHSKGEKKSTTNRLHMAKPLFQSKPLVLFRHLPQSMALPKWKSQRIKQSIIITYFVCINLTV